MKLDNAREAQRLVQITLGIVVITLFWFTYYIIIEGLEAPGTGDWGHSQSRNWGPSF